MPQVSFAQLVAGVCSGESLISFPTDTVPALAARPDCSALIFTAKQRSFDKPLILMGAAIADLLPYIEGTPEERKIWVQVMTQYWPGPLTLVLPASERLPLCMNPLDPSTIGIRIPDHPTARSILSKTGPLATTSVNRSGAPPLQTMAEIEAQFPEVLTLFEQEAKQDEGGDADCIPQHLHKNSLGTPSTVAKWNNQGWEILRQGAIQLKP